MTTPTSLRSFLIIWIGQTASILGSEMTSFAITIWAWEITGQATPLSLIIFFSRTPRVIAAFFAGVFVDRLSRKQLMMIGDTVAGLSTVAILLLFWSNHLEIWHLYITAVINGGFGYFQSLAFSASMSMIVPKQHYARATAMGSLKGAGANIFAPALAGALYYVIGLTGILVIDIATFFVAVSTIWIVQIPQPTKSEVDSPRSRSRWQQLTFGFRYIFERPSAGWQK